MKKNISILIGSIASGIGLIIASMGIASAWDFGLTGSGVCNTKTGKYDLTWTITNPENETGTVDASDRASVPVGSTIAAGTSKDYTESVSGTSTSESLTVEVDYPSDKNVPAKTFTIDLAGDCKAPPEPPVDEPKVPSTNPPQVKAVPKGGVDTGGGWAGKI